MKPNLLAPKDAAAALGISKGTITRCVKNGAPVHRWGSTGYRYMIDVDEFTRWMERQGQEKQRKQKPPVDWENVEELARRRRASLRAI